MSSVKINLAKMGNKILNLYIMIGCVGCVINSEMQTFHYCMKQTPNPGFKTCFGEQALSMMRTFDDSSNITLGDGLLMVKDEKLRARSLPDFLENPDPVDFRTMFENAGIMIGERTLQWDMAKFYPGLMLRVGPSVGLNGVLEFVMDKHQDRDDRAFYAEEPSTARILTKQFVLPLLLGLKFKLASLLPLIFWILILLCKKGLFILKIGAFLSGVLGFGSVFSLSGLLPHLALGAGFGGGHQPSLLNVNDLGAFGHHGHHHPYNDHLSSGYYKSPRDKLIPDATENVVVSVPQNDNFYDYEKKVFLNDRTSKMHEREDTQFEDRSEENNNAYRNFAWQTRI